jgi:hypothetical protein
MKTKEIIYKGIPLEVDGMYHKGEPRDYEYPGSSHEFEIFAVYAGGATDIKELLDLEDIELTVLDKFYE